MDAYALLANTFMMSHRPVCIDSVLPAQTRLTTIEASVGLLKKWFDV